MSDEMQKFDNDDYDLFSGINDSKEQPALIRNFDYPNQTKEGYICCVIVVDLDGIGVCFVSEDDSIEYVYDCSYEMAKAMAIGLDIETITPASLRKIGFKAI